MFEGVQQEPQNNRSLHGGKGCTVAYMYETCLEVSHTLLSNLKSVVHPISQDGLIISSSINKVLLNCKVASVDNVAKGGEQHLN